MRLKTMHFLAVLMYCLSEKHGLCSSLSESGIWINISNTDTFAQILSNKILSAEKKYHGKYPLVSMVFPLHEDYSLMFDLMVKINQKMNSFWTLITNDIFHTNSEYDFIHSISVWNRPHVYIMPLHEHKTFERFEVQLQLLNEDASFNPRADFVFIKLTNKCGRYNKPNIWVPYFSNLWKHNCMFAIMLVLSKCDFQLTVVTAKPFTPQNPCRSPNTRGINFHTFPAEYEDIRLIKESPRYFNGCSFVAATSGHNPPFILKKQQESKGKILSQYDGGLETEMLSLLSKKLGFTYKLDQSFNYMVIGCINEYTNTTGIKIESQKNYRGIEFCIGGLAPHYKSSFRYDISFTYMFSELSWYVADAGVTPQWKLLFKVFPANLWVLLVSIAMAFYLLYNKLEEHKYNRHKLVSKGEQWITAYLEIARTLLGMPSTLKPQALHLRILYIAWSLFSMQINIAFSTSLFELLRNPPVLKEIRTVQDISDAGLEVAGPNIYFKMFQDSTIDDTTRLILNNKRICTTMQKCFEQLSKNRNFCIMDRYEHVRYLIDLKKMKIHKIGQNIVTFGVSMLISRGNPLTPDINKVIIQAFEAGLIKKWEREASWRYLYKQNIEIPAEKTDHALSAFDLVAAFFPLFFGYITSFLVCIIEIVLCLFKQKCS